MIAVIVSSFSFSCHVCQRISIFFSNFYEIWWSSLSSINWSSIVSWSYFENICGQIKPFSVTLCFSFSCVLWWHYYRIQVQQIWYAHIARWIQRRNCICHGSYGEMWYITWTTMAWGKKCFLAVERNKYIFHDNCTRYAILPKAKKPESMQPIPIIFSFSTTVDSNRSHEFLLLFGGFPTLKFSVLILISGFNF